MMTHCMKALIPMLVVLGAASVARPQAEHTEIWATASFGHAVPLYTIPAGKTLYLTDVLFVRPSVGDTSDSTPTMVVMSRKSQYQAGLEGSVLLAFVPVNQNVFFSFRTPIQIKGPDTLQAHCVENNTEVVFVRCFGTLE